MSGMSIITLLTDFGSGSGYPAAMKGVMLALAPECAIVDISHEVGRHDLRQGAFLLWMVIPHFPRGTVHCAVVDPGVGTERKGLIICSGGQYLVGPDNGLLIPAAKRLGEPEVLELVPGPHLRPSLSATFHGRDIFAPVSAQLARGADCHALARPSSTWVKLSFGEPIITDNTARGEVIYVDPFGNIITNLPARVLDDWHLQEPISVEIGAKVAQARFFRAYGWASKDELFVTIGSHEHIEVAVNRGDAARRMRAHAGDPVILKRI